MKLSFGKRRVEHSYISQRIPVMRVGVSRFVFLGLIHVACYCLNNGPLLVTSTDFAERRRNDRLQLALGFLNQLIVLFLLVIYVLMVRLFYEAMRRIEKLSKMIDSLNRRLQNSQSLEELQQGHRNGPWVNTKRATSGGQQRHPLIFGGPGHAPPGNYGIPGIPSSGVPGTFRDLESEQAVSNLKSVIADATVRFDQDALWCERQGMTQLHAAAASDRYEAVVSLLSASKSLRLKARGNRATSWYQEEALEIASRTSEWGCTPIFWATSSKVIEKFLEIGGLVDVREWDSMPLLHYCADMGLVTTPIVEKLRHQFCMKDGDGFLASERAICRGHLQSALVIFEALSHPGADPNTIKFNMHSLFENVVNDGMRCTIFDQLVTREYFSKLMDRNKRKLLQLSNNAGNMSLVLKLLQTYTFGKDDIEVEEEQPSLLWTATNLQNVPVIRTLLGIDGITDSPLRDGMTAFATAIGNQSTEIVAMMITSSIEPRGEMLSSAKKFLALMKAEGTTRHQEMINTIEASLIGVTNHHDKLYLGPTNPTLVSTSHQFPFINDDAELKSKSSTGNRRSNDRLKDLRSRDQISLEDLDSLVLNDLCLNRMPSRNPWHVANFRFNGSCHNHRGDKRMSCLIVQDLLLFLQILEVKLAEVSRLMKYLKPRFTVVGSVAEGTRIGIGNEVDVCITFLKWMKEPPFKVEGDPFSLKRNMSHNHEDGNDVVSKWLGWIRKRYFHEEEIFLYNTFKDDLLIALDRAVEAIYKSGQNPKPLRRVTRNSDYIDHIKSCLECTEGQSRKDRLMEQCVNSVVTVGQTKIGACLQFEWCNTRESEFGGIPTYASIDLIPTFAIDTINSIDLSRIANTGMMMSPPEGCIKFLKDYTMNGAGDRVLDDDNLNKEMKCVILKTLNCRQERSYYIKPGQLMPDPTFFSPKMTSVYSSIKALKKLLDVKISMYGIKKLLRQQNYERFANLGRHDLLFQILSQPEIKAKFEDKIDFERWYASFEAIYLKRPTTHLSSILEGERRRKKLVRVLKINRDHSRLRGRSLTRAPGSTQLRFSIPQENIMFKKFQIERKMLGRPIPHCRQANPATSSTAGRPVPSLANDRRYIITSQITHDLLSRLSTFNVIGIKASQCPDRVYINDPTVAAQTRTNKTRDDLPFWVRRILEHPAPPRPKSPGPSREDVHFQSVHPQE